MYAWKAKTATRVSRLRRVPTRKERSRSLTLISRWATSGQAAGADGAGSCWVVGVGAFAAQQAERALAEMPVRVGRITHPSPASPKANRGWAALIEEEFRAMGIQLPHFKVE